MMILIVTTHSLVLTADDKKTITEDNVALLKLLFICPHLSMKNCNRVQNKSLIRIMKFIRPLVDCSHLKLALIDNLT